jgi:hypothetical protein
MHLEETKLREFLDDIDMVRTGLAFYFDVIQVHSSIQQGDSIFLRPNSAHKLG